MATGRGGRIPIHIAVAHEAFHRFQHSVLLHEPIPEDIRELATHDRKWNPELDVSSIVTYDDAIKSSSTNPNAKAFIEAGATWFEIRVSEETGVPQRDTRRHYSDH